MSHTEQEHRIQHNTQSLNDPLLLAICLVLNSIHMRFLIMEIWPVHVGMMRSVWYLGGEWFQHHWTPWPWTWFVSNGPEKNPYSITTYYGRTVSAPRALHLWITTVVLLSGLYPFSALNPDCFIHITWDSPWYLVSISGWYHHVWCILYTNDVILGTLLRVARIRWCCLFSYVTSELWRDRLWACFLHLP